MSADKEIFGENESILSEIPHEGEDGGNIFFLLKFSY
jgi:hypothetical protein